MRKIIRYGYFVLITVFGVISLISSAQPVYGQWSIDPTVNNAICNLPSNQDKSQIVSDGAGGAIIVWEDSRNGSFNGQWSDYDIYAQRINADGHVQWQMYGVPICTASGKQTNPQVVSDGSGGAIITWQDDRSDSADSTDIYAQRINAQGQIQWAANGIAICTNKTAQFNPAITSDSLGGAIITWQDERIIGGYSEIYAQRINASGVTQWAPNGVFISGGIFGGNKKNPKLVSNGYGGAIITWTDSRNVRTDIYAQKINASGQVQWATNGVPICTAAKDQDKPQIATDRSGGAIITWEDFRADSSGDIYAMRIYANGKLLPGYDGFYVCADSGSQIDPQIVSNAPGSAIIAWNDDRYYSRIYAQRVNFNANTFRLWTLNGVPVCKAPGNKYNPRMISDGSGGAIITWEDSRWTSSTYPLMLNIYIQHINVSGQVLWTSGGLHVCEKADPNNAPLIVGDGNGGAIIGWMDMRNSTPDMLNNDVYASKVDQFGVFPGYPKLTQVQDVPGDQGGKVTVSWDASPYDVSSHQVVTGYSIWRGIDRQTPSAPLFKNAPSSGASSDFTQSAGGHIYRTRTVNGVQTTWEWLADVPSHDLKHYSYTAATTSDSSGSGTPYFKYFVSAQTSNKFEYWDSQADSGYSIDNLAPNAPANVMGSAVANTVELHWNPNSESDLGGYDVFRGSVPGFNPDTMSTYATTTDTVYTDSKPSSSGTAYYVVRAVDVHGNQSPSSNEVSVHLTAVQDKQKDGLPTTFALKQNYPNPFNPTTVIPYQLASKSHVTLTIYNVLGQQVAMLVNSDMKAGRYQARWDAHDMPSGVYIYLLRAGSFMQSRKLILIK